ncbi:MAG: hypothetical protein HYS12_23325 [Planctomycetes bacterium]|nr:hypothetical protein [Planctomycetota bacterium]
MPGLCDDMKWEIYTTYLSANRFRTGEQPDPTCLELLLRDLGVTLEQLEKLIEGESAGGQEQKLQEGA